LLLQKLSGPVAVNEQTGSALLIEELKNLPNPPLVELKPEEIYVRRCRLAGDAVDYQMGCFRTHDLEKLLKLAQGAPALIGHNRQSIAVARFFGGAVETHGNHHYIVPRFYWPKAHSEAEDFRVLLDCGIITEASIAFTFSKPTCSICAKDIRDCEHQPGTHYGLKLCHYYYDGVERVLEGSFVYRGAEPGTGILAEISDLNSSIKGRKKITIQFGGRIYEAIAPLDKEEIHAPAA
jgi:hypothetical protein